jgi:hypothetical protein
MIRISASDLQCYQRYRDNEDVTLEECLAQLRRERPATPAMMAGSALHGALEHATYDTDTSCLKWNGYLFFFDCDIDLTIPDVRELKGEMDMITPSGPATVVGVVDSLDGSICDYKLSARFDAERLAESWQWRCYLSIFNCSRFLYKVFVGEEIKPQEWSIRDYHEMAVYRYVGMEEQLQREIEECASFMSRYLLKAA